MQPSLGGITFDAVLSNTLEFGVTYTNYPIESGANVTDHGITEPFVWEITGAISDYATEFSLGSFGSGFVSNLDDSGYFATAAGLTSGWLTGGDGTRSATALGLLIELANSKQPFDVDAGDIFLRNMVITSISRTADPTTEGALIFKAELMELSTLDVVLARGNDPKAKQLRETDPARIQAIESVNKGRLSTNEITD